MPGRPPGFRRVVLVLALGSALLADPASAGGLTSAFLASDATSFYLPVTAAWFGIVSALPDRPAAVLRPALAREALCASTGSAAPARALSMPRRVHLAAPRRRDPHRSFASAIRCRRGVFVLSILSGADS